MIEFADPKYDAAFKKIFGVNSLKKVTIAFLNTILEYEGLDAIADVDFGNNERNALVPGLKETIVDVHCTDFNGRQFIIEMQNAWQAGFAKRLETYATKAHAEQLKDGIPFDKVQPVAVVAITKKFNVFPKKKSYKSIHVMLDKHTYEHDFKSLTIALIQLPKFKKKESEIKTDEDRWLYLLKCITKHHEIPKILSKSVFADACKALNKLTWSPNELAMYEKDMLDQQAAEATQDELEIAKKDAEQAEARGKAEGIAEIAKKMLQKKKPLVEIAELTGLSVEEIKKL